MFVCLLCALKTLKLFQRCVMVTHFSAQNSISVYYGVMQSS